MSCCTKCCESILPYRESELTEDIFLATKTNLQIPLIPETDIDLLKDKIICEYKWIISELEKGHTPELEFLLEEISAVDIENEIDNREFIIQYYLNNDIWKEKTLLAFL